jgi:hypothetical protein
MDWALHIQAVPFTALSGSMMVCSTNRFLARTIFPDTHSRTPRSARALRHQFLLGTPVNRNAPEIQAQENSDLTPALAQDNAMLAASIFRWNNKRDLLSLAYSAGEDVN